MDFHHNVFQVFLMLSVFTRIFFCFILIAERIRITRLCLKGQFTPVCSTVMFALLSSVLIYYQYTIILTFTYIINTLFAFFFLNQNICNYLAA